MNNLYNKRVSPTTNEPQKGISYLEREREGERERGGCAGHQADIFKVRVGLGEIKGREIQIDTER